MLILESPSAQDSGFQLFPPHPDLNATNCGTFWPFCFGTTMNMRLPGAMAAPFVRAFARVIAILSQE